MIKTRYFLFGIALWGLSLTALSYLSDYSLQGSVKEVSLEIATMLTPAGMTYIFSDPEHWLRPYYEQSTRRAGGFLENAELSVVYLFFGSVSIGALIYLRRGLRE